MLKNETKALVDLSTEWKIERSFRGRKLVKRFRALAKATPGSHATEQDVLVSRMPRTANTRPESKRVVVESVQWTFSPYPTAQEDSLTAKDEPPSEASTSLRPNAPPHSRP
jgi:hypothetical protein